MTVASLFSPILQPQLNSLLILLAAGCLLIVVGLLSMCLARINAGILGAIGKRAHHTSYMSTATVACGREIQTLLQDLQKQFKALRVCVFQFHNGEYFMLANHAWKVSCTYEALGPGIGLSMVPAAQGLPATSLIDWVDPIFGAELLPRGVSVIDPCDSEIAAQCPFGREGYRILHYNTGAMAMATGRAIANMHGVCHSYAVPIIDQRTRSPIGALSMQFGELFDEAATINETELCVMCHVAEKIQYYLTTDYTSYRKRAFWLLRWLFPDK